MNQVWELLPKFAPETLVGWTTGALRAFVLVFVGWWIARRVGRAITRTIEGMRGDEAVARFLGEFVRWALSLAALIAAAEALGFQTSSLMAVFASAGLAIGLALQGSLANVASGLVLLVFRPFSLGHWITLSGKTGRVSRVGFMFTEVTLPDGTTVIVPNAKVTSDVIENHTEHDRRRGTVRVGVAYGVDLDVVRAALTRAVESVPGVLRDGPESGHVIMFVDFGASSLDWVVHVWAREDSFQLTLEQVRVAIYRELNAAKVSIPFPQLDVHLNPSS